MSLQQISNTDIQVASTFAFSNANFSGNVGIGTTSPAAPFHLIGSGSTPFQILQTNNNSQGPYLAFLQSSGSRVGYVGFGGNATTGGLYLHVDTSNPIVFETNATEAMRIDSSGNVGIGTNSPSSFGNLAVVSSGNPVIYTGSTTSGSAGGITIQGAGSGSYPSLNLQQNTTNYWSVQLRGDTNLHLYRQAGSGNAIVDSGYFLVNIANPSFIYSGSSTISSSAISCGGYDALTLVDPTVGQPTLNFAVNNSTPALYRAASIRGFLTTTTAGSEASALAFYTVSGGSNIVERMRINSSGYVGIGTTNPLSLLNVSTGSATNANAVIIGPTSGTATVGDAIKLGFALQNTAGGGTGNTYAAAISGIQDKSSSNGGALGFYTQNSAGDGTPERMRIDSSGNVLIGTTTSPLAGPAGTLIAQGIATKQGAYVASLSTGVAYPLFNTGSQKGVYWVTASLPAGNSTGIYSSTAIYINDGGVLSTAVVWNQTNFQLTISGTTVYGTQNSGVTQPKITWSYIYMPLGS
jgi:hypothetical protein